MTSCDIARQPLVRTSRRTAHGYSLADCDPLIGDEIERTVSWGGRSDVAAFAGRPVRIRFELVDADIFSLQFQSPSVSP